MAHLSGAIDMPNETTGAAGSPTAIPAGAANAAGTTPADEGNSLGTDPTLLDLVTGMLNTNQTDLSQESQAEQAGEAAAEGSETSETSAAPETPPEPAAEGDETPAEADPEPEAEHEEGDEPNKGLPKGVQKRIDRLTAQRRGLESELEEVREERERLKAELEQARQTPGTAAAEEMAPEAAPLLQKAAQYEQAMETLRGIRQQVATDPEAALDWFKQRKLAVTTADQAQAWLDRALDQAQTARTEATVEARQVQRNWDATVEQNRQALNQRATKDFPWLGDKQDARTQKVEAFLKAEPGLRKKPWGLLGVALMADYIARNDKPAPGKVELPPAQRPKPKSIPAPTKTAVTTAPSGDALLAAAGAKVDANPTHENLVEYMSHQIRRK